MHILSSKPSTTATLKRPLLHMLLAAAAMLLAHPAHADLFADNEARRAILDLRQRYQMIDEENAEILANQQKMQKEIDTLRGELSRTRTREEQLARDIAELQRIYFLKVFVASPRYFTVCQHFSFTHNTKTNCS